MVVLAGNHDDRLATGEGMAALAEALSLGAEARGRLRASPWFARLGPEGAVHVEHGHHHDPDNALPHPLAPPDDAWASLGISLMQRFIAPMGIHDLVHANDRTPLQCMARTYELHGLRMPWILMRYVLAAALAFAPVFFANLVFSHSFRDTATADMAFASNLLGAMLGGALEYLALLSGYRLLLPLVAVLYLLAWLFATRFRRLADRDLDTSRAGAADGADTPSVTGPDDRPVEPGPAGLPEGA